MPYPFFPLFQIISAIYNSTEADTLEPKTLVLFRLRYDNVWHQVDRNHYA